MQTRVLGLALLFLRAADGGKSSEYKEIKGPGSTQRKLEYRKHWGSITFEKLMKKRFIKRATRRWTVLKANTEISTTCFSSAANSAREMQEFDQPNEGEQAQTPKKEARPSPEAPGSNNKTKKGATTLRTIVADAQATKENAESTMMKARGLLRSTRTRCT